MSLQCIAKIFTITAMDMIIWVYLGVRAFILLCLITCRSSSYMSYSISNFCRRYRNSWYRINHMACFSIWFLYFQSSVLRRMHSHSNNWNNFGFAHLTFVIFYSKTKHLIIETRACVLIMLFIIGHFLLYDVTHYIVLLKKRKYFQLFGKIIFQ